jgi:hypothetical protein
MAKRELILKEWKMTDDQEFKPIASLDHIEHVGGPVVFTGRKSTDKKTISLNHVEIRNTLFRDSADALASAMLFDKLLMSLGYHTEMTMHCSAQPGIIISYVSHEFHCVEYWLKDKKGSRRAIFAYESNRLEK